MPPSRLRAFVASVALTLLALACDASLDSDDSHSSRGRAEDEWARGYPAAGGARLELVNVNGSISAEAAEGASLELVAKREASARSDEAAQELLAKLEMRESARDGVVRVEVVHPELPRSANIEVRWTVRVPAGVSVDLHNENGRISLAGLSGEVRAHTVNGAVSGKALASTLVEAKTVNGQVELELAKPLTGTGSVALAAVNGGVELRLPGDSKASLSASVTNGSVRAEGFELAKSGASSRTRLEGTLGGGGTPVTLETTNGSARITNATAPSEPENAEPTPSALPAADPERIADGAVSV